jgi:uncharacterized protein (TIGR02266 family)
MDIATRFREYVRLDRQRRESGLSPSDEAHWQTLRRFLSIHFAPDRPEASDETRDSVRVPTRINVTFASNRELVRCLMTNVSRGGVFVQTEHPLPIKTQFTLHIQIDDPKRVIAAPVEVVSLGVGPGFARHQRGMGLRFLDLPPGVEKQLCELYETSVR